jgi:hypothetical protein
MRKHLPFLIVLFMVCSILGAPGASTLLAKGGPAWARGGDQGHGDHGNRDEHGRKENRGQRKKWEREQDGRYRFKDSDRRAADDYYRGHRSEFRERWRGGDAPPLAYGYVIEPRYRRYCRPAPVYLVRELPPAPYGYRYYLFNGNVVLVDDGYRVQDFIHFDINLGR